MTKKERCIIYKAVLTESYNKPKPFAAGLCYTLLEEYGDFISPSKRALKLFFELKLFKPESPESEYWFGNIDRGEGIEFRQTVLELMIEMTA
jgi:hypothetical protein